MRIALVAQDGFSKLLAAGLTFGFALQTFIIVGGVLRVVPLTGITLPFVSYGGSSIVSNFVDARAAAARLQPRRATAAERMNRQIIRVAWTAMALLVALVVGDDVLADVGRPGLAARQDNEIQRVAEFQIDRGLILAPDARAGPQPRASSRRQDALLPPLPAGEADRARRRLLDGSREPRRSREVAERRS